MLVPEAGEGAPDAIYGLECMQCDASSGLVDNDARPVGVWAVDHTLRDPTHRQYLLTIQKHLRVDPISIPAPVVDREGAAVVTHTEILCQRQGHRVRQARRRSLGPAERALDLVARIMGSAFLLAIGAGCGLGMWATLVSGSG